MKIRHLETQSLIERDKLIEQQASTEISSFQYYLFTWLATFISVASSRSFWWLKFEIKNSILNLSSFTYREKKEKKRKIV